MKKIIYLISLCIVTSYQIWANDFVTSSVTYHSLGSKNPTTTSKVKINSISRSKASKIKIENQTQVNAYTPAFIKAAKLLADAISDDFPLTIHIKFGTEADFSGFDGTESLLALTKVNFVLDSYEIRNPNTGGRNRNGNSMLVPQAIANREYLADTDPSTPDMEIKLNPNIEFNFYTDTLNTNIPDDEYDLVTLVLREMVTGCGFASSFKKQGNNANEVFLSYKNTASNGSAYPTLFDTFVKNHKGVWLTDVPNTTAAIGAFLIQNDLFFGDIYENQKLFNELSPLSGITNITNLTVNTFNKTFDNTDLMFFDFSPGTIIRSVTPLTKSILEDLGWRIDVVPSLKSINCTIVGYDGAPLTYLQQNTDYIFRIKYKDGIDPGVTWSFRLDLVKSDGEFHTLSGNNSSLYMLPINYSSLPNYEWQRDPETGAVIGYVSFLSHHSGYNGMAGTDDYTVSGFKRVLLHYAPTHTKMNVTKLNVTNTTMDADVSYSSLGATKYKINYTTSGDPTSYSIDIPNKEDISYLLRNLPTNRKTTVSVTAINANGSDTSQTITIGEDPVSSLAMVVTKTGTTIKYQFKRGTEYATDLIINSVYIYDNLGVLKMTVNAGIGETFSIASLPSGYYVLHVDVANATVFSKLFYK